MFLTKLAFASLLAYVPAAPAQQITGRFYPEKEEYLVGEPITVVFEVVNSSAETIEIADGYCPDLHEPLSIANQPPEKKLSLFGCAPLQVIAASCLSSLRDIAPGGTFHRRYLLWEVDSPGIYNVHGVLQSPDQNVRREASTALETLTHKESRYAVMSDDSAKQAYDEWAGWWFANSSTALIYAPDQCTAPQPLR
jgi:hypothetical protein